MASTAWQGRHLVLVAHEVAGTIERNGGDGGHQCRRRACWICVSTSPPKGREGTIPSGPESCTAPPLNSVISLIVRSLRHHGFSRDEALERLEPQLPSCEARGTHGQYPNRCCCKNASPAGRYEEGRKPYHDITLIASGGPRAKDRRAISHDRTGTLRDAHCMSLSMDGKELGAFFGERTTQGHEDGGRWCMGRISRCCYASTHELDEDLAGP